MSLLKIFESSPKNASLSAQSLMSLKLSVAFFFEIRKTGLNSWKRCVWITKRWSDTRRQAESKANESKYRGRLGFCWMGSFPWQHVNKQRKSVNSGTASGDLCLCQFLWKHDKYARDKGLFHQDGSTERKRDLLLVCVHLTQFWNRINCSWNVDWLDSAWNSSTFKCLSRFVLSPFSTPPPSPPATSAQQFSAAERVTQKRMMRPPPVPDDTPDSRQTNPAL